MPSDDLFIVGMHGLGDNIYTRSIIPTDKKVYLKTPWPQLFADMENVIPVRSNSRLRTQAKNEAISDGFANEPAIPSRRLHYANESIIAGLERSSGFAFKGMSMPDFGERPIAEKYAIVRPATIRSEWRAAARNPRPEYISEAAKQLQAGGFKVIVVADIDEKNEWIEGAIPPYDIGYLSGELPIYELMRLVQHSDAIVGGIGWIVPAGIAFKRNTFIICGGEGGWNSPQIITDQRMDLSATHFAIPDNFCMCRNHNHECSKTITGFEKNFANWLTNLV